MNQTSAQAKLSTTTESRHRLSDPFSCIESGYMASKFVAQQNLAAANEGWAEMKSRDEISKQDRENTP